MTDNEILKALECCLRDDETYSADGCENCPLNSDNNCTYALRKHSLNLINRQKAEIEELVHKLECLLCHATGGKLSKHSYPLEIMYSFVNDEIQDYCEEAKAEAVKDLLIRLTMHFATYRAEDEIKIKDMFQIIQKFAEETVGDNNG